MIIAKKKRADLHSGTIRTPSQRSLKCNFLITHGTSAVGGTYKLYSCVQSCLNA